jgi:hypothetical protein
MGRLTANILDDEADIEPPPLVKDRTESHPKRFGEFAKEDEQVQPGGAERILLISLLVGRHFFTADALISKWKWEPQRRNESPRSIGFCGPKP